MNDTEKINLIRKALKDHSNGVLNDGVFVFVVHDIVNGPGKITEADIQWVQDSLRKLQEEGDIQWVQDSLRKLQEEGKLL